MTWEKAVAENSYPPAVLDEFPDMLGPLFRDFFDRLADDRYGVGNWEIRHDGVTIEEYEPFTRDREYVEDDPDEPTYGRVVTYYDTDRHFRAEAWFRAKEAENGA